MNQIDLAVHRLWVVKDKTGLFRRSNVCFHRESARVVLERLEAKLPEGRPYRIVNLQLTEVDEEGAR